MNETFLRLETPAFFPATRHTALARAALFAPEMGNAYRETRNHDLGPHNRSNTSVLSPFLSHRIITESELLHLAIAHHGEKGAEKFISEVYWRTYFKGWLESRPSVWARYKSQVAQDFDALCGGRLKAYERAVAGEVGVDCFDHWANELVTTGWLHNHARMWFASIWIFTLGLPWSLGADFFYRHLLDGDAASNTLSWRWVAGLHTKGKAYTATASNIARYTDGRFETTDRLATSGVPLEDNWNGPPSPAPAGDSPAPGVPTMLVLHEDDLHPESISQLRGLDIVRVVGLVCTEGRSSFAAEELTAAFTTGAVTDALERAAEAFGAPASMMGDDMSLNDAAQQAGAQQIVAPYAPVGPVRDRLRTEIGEIPIAQVQRSYDAKAWPYCTKGFFALRKQIPAMIRNYA